MIGDPSSHRPRNQPIETVGIIAKTRLDEAAAVVRQVTAWLAERNVKTVVESETARHSGLKDQTTCPKDDLPKSSDLLLVLGGDGTLLGVAHRIAAAAADVPVLAVNFGSLGFLTEITLPELYDALHSVLTGTAGIDERRMLRSQVLRNGTTRTDRLVLNDVVISKAALSSLIELSVSVGDQFVTCCRADGIVVASPTGSTAYNLSLGGPIVHPAVDALLLTPIAPHTLTNRPIVLPTHAPVRIEPALDRPYVEASISFDGQYGFTLEPGDVITVSCAEHALKVVRADARNYFAVLREKLKWGER